MNTFLISNFSLYPSLDFTEEFVISQEVVFVKNYVSSVSQTDTLWQSVNDASKNSRKIQSIIASEWKVEMVIARNIDLSLLTSADSVLVTTESDGSFNIFNIKLTYEEIPNTRNFKVTLVFDKIVDENIFYHNSSDVVEAYKEIGIQNVNEINFTVKKPSFVQRTHVYLEDYDIYGDISKFQFDLTDYNTNIVVGSYFYCHFFNIDIDDLSYNVAECLEVSETKITFALLNESDNYGDFAVNETEITIDYEPELGIYSAVTTTEIEINTSIYTYLFSKYLNNPVSSDEQTQRNGFETYGQNNSNDIAHIKVWLKSSELWKIKLLYLASAEDIILKQKDKDNIIPFTVKDMIQIKEKDTLIDLFEYDIYFNYNLSNVNLFR